MSKESLSTPVRVPRSESLSWNPILELLETSSILARRQTSKHREIDHEEDIARSTNGKFTKGHESENILVEFNEVSPLCFDGGEKPFVMSLGISKSKLLGFEKRNDRWYLDVGELAMRAKEEGLIDEELDVWSIPVEEIRDSRQIISFEVSPASRQ